jgi:tetratricopeptide (TPR) repeat protein
MGKAAKTVDDVIAACNAEIAKHRAQGETATGMLAADYESRAFAYEVKGMAPEAKADYDQAVTLAPGFITFFNRGQFLTDASLFAAAADDLTKAIALYDAAPPRQRPVKEEIYLQAHFQRGEALRRDEHYAEAVADYTLILAAQPRDDLALTQRALAYSHLGRLDEDIADLTRVLDLKKPDPIVLYNRGLAYDRKGDDARALADFSDAITRLPGFAVPYVARGKVLERMGQQGKALADYRKAAALDPGLDTATAALARLEGK